MKKIILKKGKERSLLRKHPWIFSGAIEKSENDIAVGETVEVLSSSGVFLARAAFSPHSQIRARIWTFDPEEKIDSDFFDKKITQALRYRESLPNLVGERSLRIVNSESDGLPGLIVDRYENILVVQFLSAGTEQNRKLILESLKKIENISVIYERSDTDARKKEGLTLSAGIIQGELPDRQIKIIESGINYNIDIETGHKTGFYLDQKLNRRILKKYAAGKRILNCFSYTGGFSLAAIAGGAKEITNIDSSREALETLNLNMNLNNMDIGRSKNICGDVFRELRYFRNSGDKFDLIVLDPPKFADSQAKMEKAAKGYKDINYQAFRILEEGGVLFTFSCSGLMQPELFRKIVADAALDAGRKIRFAEQLFQSPDHPFGGEFPEGLYLKGVIVIAE
ncbi:MAG: class I SAM-dependent methyltransferase [Ignavibacteriales bacterium]|nr:class I SAM-dependent methyltransferase [Ignavibacteriales bacterium]MCF8436522.1 class I SAM-dependent methyltransferase [Ignavibacteriales bacterium]